MCVSACVCICARLCVCFLFSLILAPKFSRHTSAPRRRPRAPPSAAAGQHKKQWARRCQTRWSSPRLPTGSGAPPDARCVHLGLRESAKGVPPPHCWPGRRTSAWAPRQFVGARRARASPPLPVGRTCSRPNSSCVLAPNQPNQPNSPPLVEWPASWPPPPHEPRLLGCATLAPPKTNWGRLDKQTRRQLFISPLRSAHQPNGSDDTS